MKGMSGRFILALAGLALLVPFFFLPRGAIGMALLGVGGLALLVSLAEAFRQLFNDLHWMMRRFAARQSAGKR